MKTSNYFVSVAVLLIFATVVSAGAIPAGSILVSARGNATGIIALDLSGTVVGSFVPTGTYSITSAQQISPNGDILLADATGDCVERYDVNGSYLGTISGTTTGKHTNSIAIANPIDGSNLAFVQHNSGVISSFDLTTNTVVNTSYTWGHDVSMRGSVVGPDGDIYFPIQNDGVYKLTQDLSTLTRVVNDSSLASASNMVFGPDGMLYITTYVNNGVVRYDLSLPGTTAEIFVSAGSGGLSKSTGLMFHPTTGNLLVGSYNTDKILEYDGSTGAYVDVFASGIDTVWSITMAPSAVPEPSTLALLLMGSISFVVMWYRRRS